MIRVINWFDNHQLAISAHFDMKKTYRMSENLWWILLLVIQEIAVIVAILCKSLLDHGTLLCNQHHMLKRIILDINSNFGIIGRLSEVQRGVIGEASHQLSDLV